MSQTYARGGKIPHPSASMSTAARKHAALSKIFAFYETLKERWPEPDSDYLRLKRRRERKFGKRWLRAYAFARKQAKEARA